MPYPTPETGKTIPEYTAGTVDGNGLFYMSKNNQGWKVDGDQISDYANGSKVYNSLNTTSKNIVGAINEVKSDISNLPSPMVFKGTLGTGGTITVLPAASASNEGWTYKVIEDGTYASQTAKEGDVFTSDGSDWILIPAGDDVEDTWRAVKLNGVEILGNAISTGAIDFVAGTNVTLTNVGGVITISVTIPDAWTDVIGTLTAGNTSITLSSAAIHTTSTIEVYTDPEVWHSPITVSEGSVIVPFDAQASDVLVKVRVT